jgi:hypothetical protein
MDNNLIWLQRWYQAQCNEDWEHQFGVKIETLDNPGWSITIDLEETDFEALTLNENKKDGDESWFYYKIENHQFLAACSPGKLDEMIGAFRQVIESTSKSLR